MRIVRVVCTPDGVCREPGDIIEKDFVPDECVVQEAVADDTWGEGVRTAGRLKMPGADAGRQLPVQESCALIPKKITRYVIEGKARVTVKKTVDGERTVVENALETQVGEAYEGELIFSIGEEERILGLGQHEDGIANYRNCTQYLYQNNMQIPMPVFLSTAGYAVLLDADCLMVYEEKGNRITLRLDAVEQIAYYVIAGEDMHELVQGIRRITGKAAMLPKWAYGYIQSRERYRSQEEIRQVAEEFRRRDIPVSCLVQDWLSWEDGKWGDKHLDKERYPDMKGLTDQLHDFGMGLMISVWPNMNKGGGDNREMMEAGKLYANLSTYDAFDGEARKLYWKQCEKELFAGGVDAWWCDSTEPFTPDWGGEKKKTDQERYQISRAELTKYMDARKANVYALYHAKGIHDNQRKAAPDMRVVNLTRSGYLSSQKYGTILWSGDIAATWDVLKRQIQEGLQMAASGIPYWNLDIGGFFAGNLEAWKRWSGAGEGTQPWFWHGDFEAGVNDRGYRELYVRLLQYCTSRPVMRSHGTD
ncbi:MAG: glycoside hydrolase, partial [Acetatifactor sp.]|nr:glycoside hydrolase [Acetatifactor sp.]